MRGNLHTMRAGIPTTAALRSSLCGRRDLLLEILALRHQLAVLRRSDRRLRQSDRLFWLCLRRWWPQWREALVLVQPATVARWHREGLRGCWTRRLRRQPGRPRIDAQLGPPFGVWPQRTPRAPRGLLPSEVFRCHHAQGDTGGTIRRTPAPIGSLTGVARAAQGDDSEHLARRARAGFGLYERLSPRGRKLSVAVTSDDC